MFVYKHTEKIEYVKKLAYFLREIQTLRVNNSRVLTIKNAKLSGYYFYKSLNIWGDFQICNRPLKHLLLSEICARELCEKFAYKHSETIEYVKN